MGVRVRKGQISLFIILAVVLLIIVVTFLLLQQKISPLTNPPETIFTTDGFTPTQLYVRQCVQDSLREGLNRAGIQGGYLTLPTQLTLPTKYVAPSPSFPLKTPVWVDNGEVYMPTIEQIESELALWLDKDTVSCLTDIGEFPTAIVQSQSEPKNEVTITKDGIIVDLSYDLVTEDGDRVLEDNKLSMAFPVDLWDVLDTGRTILEAHSNDPFLGSATLDLMSLDGERVPLADLSLRCGEQKWQSRQVQNRIKELLYYNIPRIRVQNTQHRPFNEPLAHYVPFADIDIGNYEQRKAADTLPKQKPSDLYDFQHYYWDIGLSKQAPVTASFRYLENYPMTFSVSPSENGILSSKYGQPSTDFLSFFCVQSYKFTYDLVYLVEVAVTDPNAWSDGDDLTLRFALPVQLDNNIPTTTPVNFQSVSDLATTTEFCNNRFDQQVSIYVQDKATSEDVAGAQVYYECGGISCNLGSVKQSDNGAVTRLRTSLPQGCYGGVIRAESDSITTTQSQWNNQDEQILLLTDFTMPVPVRVVTNTVNTAEDQLQNHQSAFISVKSADGSYETSAVADGPGTIVLDLLQKEAQYNITVNVFDDGFLSGGYTGQFVADSSRRGRTLVLHTIHDTSYPTEDSDIYTFYQSLENPETYEDLYYPEWT